MFKSFVLTVSLGAILATLSSSTLSAHAIYANGDPNPRVDTYMVGAYGTVTYRPILFSSDDDGVVKITGDGSTMLDVAVYDGNGNLVIHYTGYSPWVSFRPYWVQGMTIKVRNLGNAPNNFTMRTN